MVAIPSAGCADQLSVTVIRSPGSEKPCSVIKNVPTLHEVVTKIWGLAGGFVAVVAAVLVDVVVVAMLAVVAVVFRAVWLSLP